MCMYVCMYLLIFSFTTTWICYNMDMCHVRIVNNFKIHRFSKILQNIVNGVLETYPKFRTTK